MYLNLSQITTIIVFLHNEYTIWSHNNSITHSYKHMQYLYFESDSELCFENARAFLEVIEVTLCSRYLTNNVSKRKAIVTILRQ